jgi:hypothetical protein
MAKVNLLSQKEYAEHRGCSPAAVCNAVAAGRISLIDGKIDPVVADIQWKANTRARIHKGRAQATTADQAPAAASPAPAATLAPVPNAASGAGPDLVDAAEDRLAPTGSAADAAGSASTDGAVASDPQYQSSRASREEAVARREWLRLLEDEGQLVRIDQVRAQLAAMLAPVREAFMQFAPRIAPVLAAESDPGRIQNALEIEIHKILAQLREA